MRRLRVGVTTLAALLLLAGWIVGQDKESKKPEVEPKKPEVDAEAKLKGQLPANFKKLGLSEDQKQQIYRIQISFREKLAAINKQKKELKGEEKNAIEKVLTPAQRARLKEIRTGESK